MATGLSEYAADIRSTPLSEFNWWKHHVVFFGVLFVGLPALLTITYGLPGLYSFLGIKSLVLTLANIVMYGVIAVTVVTIIGSFFGYYYDAKQLRARDSNYEPRWKLYMAVHLIPIVGPFIAIPLYVVQRYRHAGIPMDKML